MKVIIEIILQTLLAFFAILFITRILGRQQLAQLTMFEYINGITFGSIAATLATDMNQRTWHHLIGLILFGMLTYLMSYICLKSRKAAKVIEGEPVIVIQDGRILEKNLMRFRYTVDELMYLLRAKDVFDINIVKYGILETPGDLSVVKIAQEENVKISDLHIKGKQGDIPTEVIVTGNIIYENLSKRNVTVKWLISQLKMMGVKDIKDVFYATIDKDKRIYIDKIEDHFKFQNEITEEQ
ncbi:DUF421 domain-containing protein [Tepidibacter formicigenes]|jgi:uncharacterized membrane protein YcaP (DUF421 family)|uniref:Uncharacterized membrane protein YcaP, DUF421 family n=1 Tax=Tepidibacter formicigenes DSM 15518 TaxID=1123349 RepID=A0A1M6MBT5_9FIRM|nr:DUF421 domain-containing protein [Tepidibacter formicigenes]SHJ80931.1 Uncharacterized membrane protein YcaP, DUF421 family [Tepidibacter formicigenes DSM 15518]